jgi:NTE family protein
MTTRRTTTLAEWLDDGPFTLCLSAGYFGFYAHTGVVLALDESGLRPSHLCGSSAGALVAGLWGAGLSARDLERELLELRREDFWDPSFGLGLLRGGLFEQRLERLLPVRRFEDAPMSIAVSVFDVLSLTTRVLDSGPLAPAVQASCTLPLLFQPRWLDGRPLIDGGVIDRHGLRGARSSTRVLHHFLATRSPWRSRSSSAMRTVRRPGLHSLIIDGLPRLGPFRLARGPEAIAIAREATLRALEQPTLD